MDPERLLLTMVNLSDDVTDPQRIERRGEIDDDNTDNEDLVRIVTMVDETLQRCNVLKVSGEGEEEDISGGIDSYTKYVLRYLRNSDKFISFVSILLKSQAYHMANNDDNNKHSVNYIFEEGKVRTIIDLPRTTYGKPFVPTKIGVSRNIDASVVRQRQRRILIPREDIIMRRGREEDQPLQKKEKAFWGYRQKEQKRPKSAPPDIIIPNELLQHPMNVSHQFPYVGIINRLTLSPNSKLDVTISSTDDDNDESLRSLLGLDIVSFDESIIGEGKRLYSTFDEFLDVFEGSFTKWEWGRIRRMSSGREKLREFYVRWAVKEALTKALGVGMGLDFSDFETRHEGVDTGDNMDGSGDGLWKYIVDEYRRKKETATDHDCSIYTSAVALRGFVIQPATSTSEVWSPTHSGDKPGERTIIWDFHFVPLSPPVTNRFNNDTSVTGQEFGGCACVCLGCREDKHGNGADQLPPPVSRCTVSIQKRSLDNLIAFHTGR